MGRYNTYTAEQIEFLRINSPLMSRKELTEKFNAKFGTAKSVRAIKSYCVARQFNSSNDGKFKDGNRSWQTGLSKEDFKAHYSDESFGRMIHNMKESKKTKTIGDEIIIDGIPWIVVSLDYSKPYWDRRMPKRRYVWEQAYGEIPKDCMILNLDGNQMNCDLSNLACVPTKYRPQLNKNGWLGKSKDITMTAIKWCELSYLIKEVHNG